MLAGHSYDQIARAVGYANRGTAHRVVAKALAERLADNIDQLRELELARLDALQASLWPKAENGDLRAVNACVRIIDKRCRLLGLYGFKEAQEPLQTLLIDDRGNPGKATGASSGDPQRPRRQSRTRTTWRTPPFRFTGKSSSGEQRL
jgi:hypothetical protein